jgi:hypothetical protein
MRFYVYSLFSFFTFLHPISSYDPLQHNINVWLSGSAYCDKSAYSSMKIGGNATNFIVTETLHDVLTDVQGFVGVLHDTKTIHVSIRGSYSVRNWVDDFEISQVPYSTFPECNCEVHSGFFHSALAVREKMMESTNKLISQNPGYSVILSGHSYGAAVANLLAMELEHENISTILYNYGQPRTGDPAFAKFTQSKIRQIWRTTHDRDIVPHVPPKKFGRLDFAHSCTELFEDEAGNIHVCSDTDCEDTTCSQQYSLVQTKISDHLVYLNHIVQCFSSTV